MVWENKKAVFPRLDYFENKGVMSGSKEFPHIDHMKDEFRYKIEPVENQLKGYVWHGPYCFQYCKERNQIKTEMVFPLSDQGTEDIYHWLEEMYAVMEKESFAQYGNEYPRSY